MWEAHLLLLFAEATRLAETHALPKETPTFVNRYFKEKGEVSHKDFLMVDEPALITAISIWSEAKDSTGKLKELSGAFLERKKVVRCLDLQGESGSLGRLTRLRERLKTRAGDEGISWLIDRYDFSAYKMPGTDELKTDPEAYWEAVSKDSILLSTGELDKKASPIQQDSSIIRSLGHSKMPVCRLFYLPEIDDAVKSSTQ